ncbi:imidazolonepropionase [Agromyces aerolatus]|uniref:imidazolonepropionase n=1 Tax=Agromyces sp. LY-1074 TaxID=3074080 RepID=UPI00285C96A2|nr:MULTISPECIES: imidazolonepropionase [unclassified Agromyces]MDR5698644.1 imidazolonepropionase [Agromyces sp. LY-1074]MDR5704938.1 imidazolonepropionase [Agromyces sp. LY-1358]
MTRLLLTGIGELVTNDPGPDRGGGPLGILRDAAVLVEDGIVSWVGEAADVARGHHIARDHDTARTHGGPAERDDRREADEHRALWDTTVDVIDVAGDAVIPGFVDSHTHLVFGGDRADEFAARMAGRAYEAGGIRSTVAATRAATDDDLRDRLAGFVAELHAQGTTTFEVKSGYGLSAHDEERLVRLAREVTDEVTFLGAHVVPAEYAAQGSTGTDAYVDLVIGDMLAACAPHARWIDVFCERGAFSEAQSRRVLEAGLSAGLGVRVHGNQLGPGAGVALAVELGAASVDHCTYLSEADVSLLASSDTVATLLPGVEFSTRHPYPDARRLLDAGVTVALASDCNPGSSFTSSLPFCIALAVREMGMTPAEAVWAATAGGARALRREDVGVLRAGARADLVRLAAPSHVHLAYRPGVPLVRAVWQAGTRLLHSLVE